MSYKRLFIFLATVVFSLPVWAHPGIGLVEDSKGTIYYTDLNQVWKITPDGKKTIAVPNVHTHQLYIDAKDDLYGENLEYEGDATKKFKHYLWVLHPNGKLETVVGPKEAFVTDDYSLVRDSIGNQYWVQRFKLSRFMKESPDGKVTQLAEGFYNNIKWMYASPEGELYFVNGSGLYKIDSNNTVRPVAKNLAETTPQFAFASPNNDILGIWSDKKKNIYVAVFSGQVIKKISPLGIVTTVLKSEDDWSPSSGLFDKEGNLWVMEYNTKNDVRVREIKSFTGVPKTSTTSQKVVVTIAVLLGIITAFVIIRTGGRRRKR